MSAVIFLEPFPIRNSHGTFAWIGAQFAKAFVAPSSRSDAFQKLRIAVNHVTYAYIVKEVPEARPFLIMYDAETLAAFDQLLLDWDTSGIETWGKIQNGSDEFIHLYKQALTKIQEQVRVDSLLYWGTNMSIRHVSEELGIPVHFAEYGAGMCADPFGDVFCLDRGGVNGDASSRYIDEKSLAKIAPETAVDCLLRFKIGDHTAHDLRFEWVASFATDMNDLYARIGKYEKVVFVRFNLRTTRIQSVRERAHALLGGRRRDDARRYKNFGNFQRAPIISAFVLQQISDGVCEKPSRSIRERFLDR